MNHQQQLLTARFTRACNSTLKDSQVAMKTAIFRIPDLTKNIESKEFLQFESSEILHTESYGGDIITTEFFGYCH